MKTIKWPLIKYFSDKKIQDKLAELEVQRWARIWCYRIKSIQVFARSLSKMRQLMQERKVEIAKGLIARLAMKKMEHIAKQRGANFETRLKNKIRQTLNMHIATSAESVYVRARHTLFDTVSKFGNYEGFRAAVHNFMFYHKKLLVNIKYRP